jgi:DNA polymerase
MNRLVLDLETRSRAELTDVGAWVYSCDPSTEILCAAVSVNGGAPEIHDLRGGLQPPEWSQAVREGWEIWARNVSFEYSCITNASKWEQPNLNAWRDSAAVSAASGFPVGLDECAKALRIPEQKDGAGTALINFWSKPVNSGGHKGEFRSPDDHPEKWADFLRYCHQDVVTDLAILRELPPLTEREMTFWLATWRMNVSGIYIDLPLVRGLNKLVSESRDLIGGKLLESTNGLFDADVTSNHKKVLGYVNEHGAGMDSVAKPKVKEALARDDLQDEARDVLEARQALGKTSVSKLEKLLAQTGADSRLRFYIRPHGTETGRDSSLGVQLTNLPRGGKFPLDRLLNAARDGHTQEFMELAYEKGKFDPLGAVVTCLRGCFAATPGNKLTQCDWSAVEPRIGAWLVQDEDMLAAFRLIDEKGGLDIYQLEAARFYGCKPTEISGDRRQFGKVFVLGSQYGAGGPKLQLFAKDQYSVILADDEAQVAVDVWRALHPKWTRMWSDLDIAAQSAVRSKGRVFNCGRVAFCFDGTHLRMRLPSKRIMTFPFASIKLVKTPWGAWRDQLHYWGMIGMGAGKKWREFPIAGPAIFNKVVQSSGACIMRESVVKLDAQGRRVVLRVHDELIEDTSADDGLLKRVMLEVPAWADGLPLNGAGWSGAFYRKE